MNINFLSRRNHSLPLPRRQWSTLWALSAATLLVASAHGCASGPSRSESTGTYSADSAGSADSQPAAPLDSDGDGVLDADEVVAGTDPGRADSDGDGVPDGVEIGSDPSSPIDSDKDGLADAIESDRADNDNDGLDDEHDGATGWQLTDARFVPYAVANDGVDTATVEVRITAGAGVTSVSVGTSTDKGSPLKLAAPTHLAVDGAAYPKAGVQLYDDGSHGDRIGGDGVWSRGGLSATGQTPYAGGRIDIIEFDEVAVTTADGEERRAVWTGYAQGHPLFESGAFALGVVRADSLRTPVTVDAQLQKTGHLYNLIDPTLAGAPFRVLASDPSSMRAATTLLFDKIADVDFVYAFCPSRGHTGAAGLTVAVSSQVKGIGKGVFNESAKWGSAGRLTSLVSLDFQTNGPILHETLHRWGVFIGAKFGVMGSHWGYTGANGQLGGFDPASVVDIGDGKWTVKSFGLFANGGDSKPYSAIELYLMGLLPAQDVPPLMAFVAGKNAGKQGGKTVIAATALVEHSIDDLVAALGPRVPAAGAAPTAFDAAFVVISEHALGAAEMTFFDLQAEIFGGAKGTGSLLSFAAATGGRATMNTATE